MENSNDIISLYIIYRSNSDNDKNNDSIFSSLYNIPMDKLKAAKGHHKDWSTKVLKSRRGAYAEKMTKVDSALFSAAQAGDTKAADLLYRRFDNWNPRVMEQTNNYYNFAELVKGLKKPQKATIIRREL